MREKKSKLGFGIYFLGLVLLIGVPDCWGALPACESPQKNHLIVGTLYPVTKLMPEEGMNFVEYLIIQSVFQGLVKHGPSGRITSDLAEKWEQNDAENEFTFFLNSKAVFHDGSPVTSTDVARSLSAHFWPGSKSVLRSYLSGVIQGADRLGAGLIPSGITTPTPTIIKIKLVRSYLPFLPAYHLQ